jgi:hypothetical protein
MRITGSWELVAVPEPASSLAMLLGALFLLQLGIRRHRGCPGGAKLTATECTNFKLNKLQGELLSTFIIEWSGAPFLVRTTMDNPLL